MTKEELDYLAYKIEHHFTLFAFRCSCKGQHPDCAGIREDEVELAKKYQLERIVKYIKEFKHED